MDTNILVIGSGISGLTYAIKMAEQNPSLEIVMISKKDFLGIQELEACDFIGVKRKCTT